MVEYGINLFQGAKDGQTQTGGGAAANDLECSRRPLVRFHRADPTQTRSGAAHRPPAHRSAPGARWHHLHHAQRLPMELAAQGVWRRLLGAPHLPALGGAGHLSENLDDAGAALRRNGRRGFHLAVQRHRAGQGAFWGDQIGPNPTDRAKNGSKRSVLTEQEGYPIAAVVAAANVHDSMLLQDTLEAVVIEPPNPHRHEQHLCLDKGYDTPAAEATALVFGYMPHIRRIGEAKLDERALPVVVERLPGDSGALGKESIEISGVHRARLGTVVVSKAQATFIVLR